MTVLGNFDITSQLSWNPVKEMISTDNHTISYILLASYIILREYNLGFEWLYLILYFNYYNFVLTKTQYTPSL